VTTRAKNASRPRQPKGELYRDRPDARARASRPRPVVVQQDPRTRQLLEWLWDRVTVCTPELKCELRTIVEDAERIFGRAPKTGA